MTAKKRNRLAAKSRHANRAHHSRKRVETKEEQVKRLAPDCKDGWSHLVPPGETKCVRCGWGYVRMNARPKKSGGSDTKAHLAERDGGWRCFYCWTPLAPEEATIDHCWPVTRGGSNLATNKVLSCRPCNEAKGDRTLDEWRRAGWSGRRPVILPVAESLDAPRTRPVGSHP